MINAVFIRDLGSISIITYSLKLFFISICTYYTFLKIINIENRLNVKTVFIYIFTFIISILCSIFKYMSTSFTSIMCLFLLLSVLYSSILKNKIGHTMLITMLSLSINYIIFFLAILLNFIPNIILLIKNDYINLSIIIIIHISLLSLILKIRRLKNGIVFLQNIAENEYFDILILNISVTILFSFTILTNFNILLVKSLVFGFIAFSIIMFVTIQKSLTMYYKHKLLITELNETKSELVKKEEEIAKLEAENLKFSKTSHSIAHKQKALEYKLNQLMMQNEISSELYIRDNLNSISKEYLKAPTITNLSKTDIPQIDDMLKFLQSECIKNNIDFDLQLNGTLYSMVNHFVSRESLEILIADLVKNAIIAIKNSDNINRSILVRLGLIDGCYSLYVYDSGIEFKIDTLVNLGTKPITTHADSGGSGMGFMNTFDSLAKYQASMIINEFNVPCKDNYTKSIMVKFDKKHLFKIVSYRAEEIKNKNITNNLIVE